MGGTVSRLDLDELGWPLYLLAWVVVVTPFTATLFIAAVLWWARRRSRRRAGSVREAPASYF